MKYSMLWLLMALLSAPGEALSEDESSFLEVAIPTRPDSVMLRLTSDAPAVVTETRQAGLQPGINRLRFDWIRARLDESTVRFDVRPESGTARITALTRSGSLPKMLFYDVEAAGAVPATVRTQYLLAGIGWRIAYVGVLREPIDGQPESLDLRQSIEIRDGSGVDIQNARIVFDGGAIDGVSVRDGQRREVESFRVERLPFTRRHVYDPTRHGTTPGIEIEIENALGGVLARDLLPAGKVRLFTREGDGEPKLLGEDVFPATPLGEKAKLTTGHERDIPVERRVVFQRNENERRDRWNKVIAYDQRTRIAFKIHNGHAAKTTLVIVERPGAPFELTFCELPQEKKRLDTFEIQVELEPQKETTFEIEWLRRNLF